MGSAEGAGGELNAQIARSIVRIYRVACGRGPSKARSMFHADVVVVVLEKVLTPAEHSLVADGRGQAVVAMRASLHAAMVPSLASAVAGATSSRVHVTMGDTDHRADVAVEVFLLDRPVDPLRVAAPAG